MGRRSVWPPWPFFHWGQGSDWDPVLCGEIKPGHQGNVVCNKDDQGHIGEHSLTHSLTDIYYTLTFISRPANAPR